MKHARALLALAGLALISGSTAAWAQDPAEYADRVRAVADGELQLWITDPVMIYAIKEQNETYRDITERQIQRFDRRWISEDGSGPMIGDLLDRQASILLRDRRELSGGVITEIIVMDAYGLNVAISDPTSDYFQGDEAKYQQTYLIGPGAVHVSEIGYDESTKQIQTQVSMTVVDPDTGDPIGAVTFGISLDALSN